MFVRFLVVSLGCCLLGGWTVAAGPLEDLQAASGLSGIDGPQLLGGTILSARGVEGDFLRGIYVESCYYIKAPVAAAGETLLHWDPSRFKETDVSTYRISREPPPPELFSAFRLSSTRPADRWLLDATAATAAGKSTELHLAKNDPRFPRAADAIALTDQQSDARCNTVWQQILRSRSEAMAAGGLAAIPAYRAEGGTTIAAAAEFRKLLQMAPGIAARFTSLTDARPLVANAGGMADEAAAYVEQSLVHGHTSYCVGEMVLRKSPAAWQVVDCTYYAADTYFMSTALYEFWPWENGTLVWQVDYASAPFRGYTAGLDKVFAGREMTKDSAQGIRLFRREAEQAPRK